VSRVLAVAERSGDPALRAQALVLDGTHRVETGGDLALAHHALRRALDLLPADASYPQRKLALLALGNVAFQLGRYEESVETYGVLLELTREQGDAVEEATTRFNIANVRQRELEERPRPDALATLEPLAASALESARRAGNRQVEVRATALLAQLARGRGEPAEARRLLEQALAIAREVGHPERIMICLWLLAELVAEEDPAAARAFDAEAAALALAAGGDRALAYAWQSRMRVDWRTRPRAEAIATSLRALEAIEALAARQGDEAATVGLFGAWARDYRRLAGLLLAGDPPDPDAAFAVLERMRARVLLAALAAGRSTAERSGDDPASPEAAALGELIAVQRRLLEPGADPAARAALLAQLEAHELALAAARAAVRREGGALDPLGPGAFASLSELRARLRADEALLVFQLAPERDLYGDFAGGSWLLVVTRDGVRARRLPGPAEIDALVPAFAALVDRRTGSEAAAARRLGEMLLGDAIDALPADVERLLVVPDGSLFQMPFEILVAGARAAGEPLGVRYEIALVPSATALLRARALAAPAPRRSVLVLADPELAIGATGATDGTGATRTREAALGDRLALGRLPAARREGRLVSRLLAPTSELLTGRAASERALARPDLGEFAVLHLAAHALADGERPQRSAVLLTAADEREDGLLQSREIGGLPLAGRVVVLSACRTAAGATAGGEGPLSLARAFQAAGARAVVASRWALRDDEAARTVGDLYRELAAGRPLGAALRAARRRAWADGRPAAAWASLVLTGDPRVDVLAGLPPVGAAAGRSGAAWAVALAAAVGLLAVGVRRRRASPRA
jgi:tetratricopeptide (TPR) repeat protein